MGRGIIDSVRLDFTKTKLYGREKEVQLLRDAYARVEATKMTEVVMLKGYSGCGKTALGDSLSQVVPPTCFLKGKFDRMKSYQPFSAIVEAFSSLCKSMSSSSSSSSSKEDIALDLTRDMSADNLMNLSKVLPHLRLLLGEDITCSRNSSPVTIEWGFEWLHKAFRDFVRVVCKHCEKTLVLFIDDLQWADVGSLNLLGSLVKDAESGGFLFLGSYRSNEVGDTHRLRFVIRDMEKSKTPVTEVHVTNLDDESINTLISDCTRSPPQQTQALARVVCSKTGGNAFFVGQFLIMLQEEEMMYMSSKTYKWEWSMDRIIGETDISDNVVYLVTKKIQKLPTDVIQTLKLAACFGSHFHTHLLAALLSNEPTDRSHRETKEQEEAGDCDTDSDDQRLSSALLCAVREGLISRRLGSSIFKFSHDKIQQSAYSLIVDDRERQELHLRIGRHVQKEYSNQDSRREWMLLIKEDQLNRGANLITDESEKVILAQRNLEAADIVTTQAAFFPAAYYLRTGLQLMEGMNGWTRNYKLHLGLCTAYAENAFCIGELEECERYVRIVLENAISVEDKYRVFVVKVDALGSQERLEEAIDAGFDILRMLGEKIPKKIHQLHVAKNLIQASIVVRRMSNEDFLSLPALEDTKKMLALKIMSTLITFCWFAFRTDETAFLCLRMFLLSLKHGLSKYSSHAFAVFGLMQGSLYNFSEAYRYGELTLKLMERFHAKECDCRTAVVAQSFLIHLRRPLHERMDSMLHAYRVGLETGDIHHSSVAATVYTMMYFGSGLPLGPMVDDSIAFGGFMERYSQVFSFTPALIWRQCALNLMGRSENPVVLTGEAMDQDEFLRDLSTSNVMGKLQALYLARMFLGYLFGDLDVAVENGEHLWRRKQNIDSTHFYTPFYFTISALSALSMLQRTGKRRYKRVARKFIKCLQSWVDNKVFNVQHKLKLVIAERAAQQEKDPEVVKAMYDNAITLAQRSGFPQDAALANERAGIYFLSQQDSFLAGAYMSRAHSLYTSWGAKAKKEDLHAKYHFLSFAPASNVRGTHHRGRRRFSRGPTAKHQQYNLFTSAELRSYEDPAIHQSVGALDLSDSTTNYTSDKAWNSESSL